MPRPPSRGSVTSPWGMRFNPNDGIWRMHYGEDTVGEGNYAPVTGTVVFAGWDRSGTGLGWAVGIRETMNPSVIWWTGHFGTTSLWNPLKVKVGAKVSESFTYLGPKGDTGAAKGPHAHQERRVNGAATPGSGTPTNPRLYYSTTAGAGDGGSAPIPPAAVKGTPLFIAPLVYNDGSTQKFHNPPRYVIVSEAGGCTVADTATAEGQALMAQLNRQGFWAEADTRSIYLSSAQLIANALRPASAPSNVGGSAEFAEAVDAALADDFAAVKANIDDQPTEFTVKPA
jgi:hypothetical protein